LIVDWRDVQYFSEKSVPFFGMSLAEKQFVNLRRTDVLMFHNQSFAFLVASFFSVLDLKEMQRWMAHTFSYSPLLNKLLLTFCDAFDADFLGLK
jgi:hypothetical protein